MNAVTETSTEETPLIRAPRSLWRNRDYLILLSGQAVSAFGSQASQLALPLLILAVTGSPRRPASLARCAGLRTCSLACRRARWWTAGSAGDSWCFATWSARWPSPASRWRL